MTWHPECVLLILCNLLRWLIDVTSCHGSSCGRSFSYWLITLCKDVISHMRCVCPPSPPPPPPPPTQTPPDMPAVREPQLLEDPVTVVSKFGFMIENCIVAARNSQPMICPAHPNHMLPIRDIAPDLVGLIKALQSLIIHTHTLVTVL